MKVTITNSHLAIRIKANANYQCVECGRMEFVQAHHKIRGDDNSMICLCGECHSQKHPNMPKALFLSVVNQPYWFNKPAARIAKENSVSSRTIIRLANMLGIMRGELSFADEVNIIGHLQKNKSAERERIKVKVKVKKAIIRSNRFVEVQRIKENDLVIKCPNCGYKWLARVERPKTCSRCKIRFDSMKWKFVEYLVLVEGDYEGLLQQSV